MILNLESINGVGIDIFDSPIRRGKKRGFGRRIGSIVNHKSNPSFCGGSGEENFLEPVVLPIDFGFVGCEMGVGNVEA